MPSEESHKDSREYLKEVVRSNGRMGTFWARGDSLCVQVRHPTYGNIRFLVDPKAFGGKGCIYDTVGPKHFGDPFGWTRLDFAEFAQRFRTLPAERLSQLGRRSISEIRKFVGSSEPISARTLTSAHHAIAARAPAAAAALAARMDQLTTELMVDGQTSLAGSLRHRGESANPTFPTDILSLYDLLGEASIFRSLFGRYVEGPEKDRLERVVSIVHGEIKTLAGALDKNAYDITLLNITMRMLDLYSANLSRMTSKSRLVPGLTRAALVAFSEEVYYGVLEVRAMAENIFAASVLTGHPPELGRWVAEFRCHDYALRELLDRIYAADPLTFGASNDMTIFFRDRFAFPPEVAWWMWHAMEKETGMPVDEAFGFDRGDVARKSGLRAGPSEEVATTLEPKALVGRHVQLLMVSSPIDDLVGHVLPAVKVTETTVSELDETGYLVAVPHDPIKLDNRAGYEFTIKKVRFGSSLPRTPPQAVMDDAFKALMHANPYKKVVVDVSAELSLPGPDAPSKRMTHIGFGLLGMAEEGRPSVFEVQGYRLVERFMEQQREAAKAWEVDYLR